MGVVEEARRRFPALRQRMEEAKAVVKWEQAVGRTIAKHSRARSVKKGVLFVEVDHPIWRSELHHRKRQILAILNADLVEADQLSDIFYVDPYRQSTGFIPGRSKST